MFQVEKFFVKLYSIYNRYIFIERFYMLDFGKILLGLSFVLGAAVVNSSQEPNSKPKSEEIHYLWQDFESSCSIEDQQAVQLTPWCAQKIVQENNAYAQDLFTPDNIKNSLLILPVVKNYGRSYDKLQQS